jgi:hypothetical protein
MRRATYLGALWALVGCTSAELPLPPPAITVPAAVTVGEGQMASLGRASAEGVVTASASGLVKVSVAAGGEVLVDTSYGQTGAATVTVTVTAGELSATATSAVTVKPVAWLGTNKWQADGPEAREHGALVVDAKARRTLLFGGSGYNPYLSPLSDAWQFDHDKNAWTKVTPTGDVPSGGGSRRVAQVPAAQGASAYLFGGYGVNGAAHNELYKVDVSATGVVFAKVMQQNPPPKRALHAFFYDAQSDAFYAFGGVDTKVYGDLWRMKLTGGSAVWEQLTVDPKPTARYGFFYGFDPTAGRLVLFSGAQGTAMINAARDAWALDVRAAGGPKWTELGQGDAVPPGRRNGCAILDTVTPRLWVFGGTADAKTSEPGLWVLDLRAGHGDWRQLMLTGEPPIRSSGIGFFDEQDGTVRLGFGNTTMDVFRDWSKIGY